MVLNLFVSGAESIFRCARRKPVSKRTIGYVLIAGICNAQSVTTPRDLQFEATCWALTRRRSSLDGN
jgi:hypothetical protein